ncbi:hypothetical protein Poli38472_014447 [Pythium oligandrum]|uniref:Peptidase S59 domain-containing protein n=1 Tax=Pythium oligandrum TaxID=41045 RepID=A0A8K1CDP6_PYTOL|nr:hypothetical protein Poli38472_014447 [Pythium oligandrum]|eukprot:TMW60986.1 hypothetical protein Poli38472_014447 [Pythium oligandrum]
MSFGGFGATGGGFGASSGFGATSSGFGSNAAASPFGGGAATTTGGFGAPSAFGAATGTTSAFGAKPATSAFGGGGFGASTQAATGTGGGMFGAQPTTGFGAAPASGFGAAATPATGFGAAAPTTGFGASGTTGGAFGSSGFGATSGSTGFGGTSGFGSNAAASPFGAKSAAASPFGQSSVFGATAQPATSAFGSTPSSGFGASGGFGTPAPASNSGGMFGGGTSAFGAKSPFGGAATSTGFGAPAATGGFGAAPQQQQQQPQVGTGNPPYQVTRETDTTGMTNYVSISRMGAYAHKSTEELRYEDYLKQKNPAEAAAVAALNAPQQAQVGFGAATAQPTSSAFGGSSGFGAGTGFGTATTAPAAATGNAFGSSFGATGGATTSSFGGFGNQQSTGGLFGNATRSVGGFSPAASQPMGTGGAFGAPATPGAFGSTAPATGGFGTTTGGFGSSFGATAAPTAQPQSGFGFGSGAPGSTGGFGASSFTKPAASTGFGFGATPSATPAATATGGGFSFGGGAGATQPGATTSMFGSATAPSTNSAFSFGGNTAKPATSSGFGFGGSSATGGFGTGGGFGSATTTGATGGLFGATTATQPTSTSLFGATGATGTTGAATGGFGFGNTSTTGTGTSLFGAAKTGSSLFGSTPATPTTGSLFGASSGGSSLFGGTTSASKPSGGFSFGGGLGSTAPSTGGFGGGFGSFGSTTPSATGQTALGGTSLFGASATATPSISAAPAQPQSLVAAPDVNPYGAGAFGAGLVEQNVKAALDQQSLKPSSSALRASSFAQDVGLPRGALENPVATRRNLLNSGYSIPVSFIRGSTFKGSKGRFSSITSSSGGTPSALRPSSEPSNGSQEDEFKFSSSLFRNSVAKRLVIEKSDRRQDASSRTNGARASVIPFTEEDSTPVSTSTHSRPLRPDDDGNYTVVFRNLANKKSFTLQVKGSQTAKEAKEEVKSVLRATMKTGVRDIQLLSNGRIIVDNLAIADMRLKDGDVIDVAVVEDIDDNDGRGFNVSKSQTDASDDGGKASKSARFMSYADFMNSAMREEDSATDLSAPVSPSCPSLKNEDYFTSPSYDRLKRMTDRELAEVDSFTVGCKGLGSVEWIGKTDVRHLDLDALIQFEKKEVIVYKDDENKHELGTGLNRPAVVELLGIFPPRKAQDPEMYKEKVKQRTADIGATYIDYSPAKGIWRFRVEHFSRYGLDEDDDDDVDMDATDSKRLSSGEAPASLRLGDEKKMSAPKRMQSIDGGKFL